MLSYLCKIERGKEEGIGTGLLEELKQGMNEKQLAWFRQLLAMTEASPKKRLSLCIKANEVLGHTQSLLLMLDFTGGLEITMPSIVWKTVIVYTVYSIMDAILLFYLIRLWL